MVDILQLSSLFPEVSISCVTHDAAEAMTLKLSSLMVKKIYRVRENTNPLSEKWTSKDEGVPALVSTFSIADSRQGLSPAYS